MRAVMNLWKVKMENCIAWKSGTARRFAPNLVLIQTKANEERRVKLTGNVSAVDALVTLEQIAKPKLTSMEDLPKSAPKGKSVGNCDDEETETSQNVPLGTIDLVSYEVLSDHGDEVEDDESTNETTEMMPPLPPDSWFKRTETFCGKFRKRCGEDHQDEENPFLDCGDGKQEQFDALQQVDPWARNAPKSEPDVKGCVPVSFTACSVCQKLGVYQRLPTKAPQYDISSEGEDRPSDISNDGEWGPDEVDLNAVTISNMSIDIKLVATDGQRGWYREITGAGESRRLAQY